MAPFAAMWEGLDIDDRLDLGLLDRQGAAQERRERRELRRSLVEFLRGKGLLARTRAAPSGHDVMGAAQRYLARSEARTMLVNLEDLWDETRRQNAPGTETERPNWVRKAKPPLERFREMRAVVGTLQEIDRSRKASA